MVQDKLSVLYSILFSRTAQIGLSWLCYIGQDKDLKSWKAGEGRLKKMVLVVQDKLGMLYSILFSRTAKIGLSCLCYLV